MNLGSLFAKDQKTLFHLKEVDVVQESKGQSQLNRQLSNLGINSHICPVTVCIEGTYWAVNSDEIMVLILYSDEVLALTYSASPFVIVVAFVKFYWTLRQSCLNKSNLTAVSVLVIGVHL